jgi:hypothetical protein
MTSMEFGVQAPRTALLAKVKRIAAQNARAPVWLVLLIVIGTE